MAKAIQSDHHPVEKLRRASRQIRVPGNGLRENPGGRGSRYKHPARGSPRELFMRNLPTPVRDAEKDFLRNRKERRVPVRHQGRVRRSDAIRIRTSANDPDRHRENHFALPGRGERAFHAIRRTHGMRGITDTRMIIEDRNRGKRTKNTPDCGDPMPLRTDAVLDAHWRGRWRA